MWIHDIVNGDINNKMSIVNFFKNSKKRDLNDNSKSDGA